MMVLLAILLTPLRVACELVAILFAHRALRWLGAFACGVLAMSLLR